MNRRSRKVSRVIWHTDMRNLPRIIEVHKNRADQCAITSPPYLNVTSFEEDQWLRLWFLGGSIVSQKRPHVAG